MGSFPHPCRYKLPHPPHDCGSQNLAPGLSWTFTSSAVNGWSIDATNIRLRGPWPPSGLPRVQHRSSWGKLGFPWTGRSSVLCQVVNESVFKAMSTCVCMSHGLVSCAGLGKWRAAVHNTAERSEGFRVQWTLPAGKKRDPGHIRKSCFWETLTVLSRCFSARWKWEFLQRPPCISRSSAFVSSFLCK